MTKTACRITDIPCRGCKEYADPGCLLLPCCGTDEPDLLGWRIQLQQPWGGCPQGRWANNGVAYRLDASMTHRIDAATARWIDVPMTVRGVAVLPME